MDIGEVTPKQINILWARLVIGFVLNNFAGKIFSFMRI